MNITEVRISPRNDKTEKLRAFASFTIDNAFVVRGLKIIQRGDGKLFVAMPSRQDKTGKNQDICHPINQETRAQIETLVLTEYESITGTATSAVESSERDDRRMSADERPQSPTASSTTNFL